ncbi:hypothetical protein [Nocardia panacis]|uniref:hypothetical protein n=1 Tax=Nocardia panacis TaxID=2340916 RepID=UPI0011C45BB8|nr:hypothetical protein [Nocardia panacis]
MSKPLVAIATSGMKQLRQSIHKMADAIANDVLRGGSAYISGATKLMVDADRNSIGRIVSELPKGRHIPVPSTRVMAPPMFSKLMFDEYGMPETKRRYPMKTYIRMWERQRGRKMRPVEREILKQGCIGMTKIELGILSKIHVPAPTLAFSDPTSHEIIQRAQKLLAEGEAANGAVRAAKYHFNRVKKRVETEGWNWTEKNKQGVEMTAADSVKYREDALRDARDKAREIWSRASKEELKEMLDSRHSARIAGDIRTFDRVQDLASRFRAIIDTKPATAGEFLRLANLDPELSKLKGIAQQLPEGNPADWKVKIFSKHFWSGQRTSLGPDGMPMFEDGFPVAEATSTSNQWRFAPDPHTGQVDMTGDLFRGRLGYLNYDYGYYDEHTRSWWSANHGDFPGDPMIVFQSTPEEFFSSFPFFDSSPICLTFRNEPAVAAEGYILDVI